MTKPGSCNNGFKSRPSMAAGNKRSNGLEVVRMKAKKTRRVTCSLACFPQMASSTTKTSKLTFKTAKVTIKNSTTNSSTS